MKIISVGGVAGGASVAARSRRLNENAEIIILEKGPFVSYSNCGLPYHISGQIAATDDLLLVSPEYFKSHYNIEARVQNEVIGVDTARQEVKVKNHANDSTYTESYDKLVLSPGTLAAIPPFAGKDKIDIFTLKTVPDLKKLMQFIKSKKPRHFTVIGGGLIGLEVAENMKLRGLDVTVVECAKHIIPFVDREMSFFAQKELIDNGVQVIVDDLVESFATNLVKLKSGRTIKTDGVVMSVGAVPCTGFLKDTGIKLDAKGYIEVNENFQTSAKNIYAIGDAIQVPHQVSGEKLSLAMAGPANKQGRFVADHLSGRKVINKGYIGSGVVKLFKLNMAHTGLREEEVKRLGKKYRVAYAAPPGIVGIMPGAYLLFSKLIFEQGSGRILGAQFCSGGQSDKRTDVIATAIKANMTVYDLLDLELCYAPYFGTGKDVINKLGYIASNLLENQFNQVPFYDTYQLLKEKKQVIDVREVSEYKAGHLAGTVNIPMGELRQRLDEIDKSKPVYVHCRTGERSYNVTMILKSHGYEAYNIAGSYEFIKVYEEASRYIDKNRENILIM